MKWQVIYSVLQSRCCYSHTPSALSKGLLPPLGAPKHKPGNLEQQFGLKQVLNCENSFRSVNNQNISVQSSCTSRDFSELKFLWDPLYQYATHVKELTQQIVNIFHLYFKAKLLCWAVLMWCVCLSVYLPNSNWEVTKIISVFCMQWSKIQTWSV